MPTSNHSLQADRRSEGLKQEDALPRPTPIDNVDEVELRRYAQGSTTEKERGEPMCVQKIVALPTTDDSVKNLSDPM